MSQLWLNIRFGTSFLQIGDPHWWSVRWRKGNKYHVAMRDHPDWRWFHIYTLGPYTKSPEDT